jgi:hypothetical protein
MGMVLMLGCLYSEWLGMEGGWICEISMKNIKIHNFFHNFVEGRLYASSLYP